MRQHARQLSRQALIQFTSSSCLHSSSAHHNYGWSIGGGARRFGGMQHAQQTQQQVEQAPLDNLLPFGKIPKSSTALPILGDTLEVLRNLPQFHLLLEKYAKEAPIIRVTAGPLSMVLVSEPDVVGHVFQSKNFVERPELDVINYFRRIHGVDRGIAFSNGPLWERARSVANKTLLVPQIVQGFSAGLIENADTVVKKWKSKGEGATVSIAADVDAFTIDSIGNIAFGEKFNALNGQQSELAQAISSLLRLTQDMLFVPFPYYRYFETSGVKEIKKAFKTMLDLGGAIVRKNRKLLEEGKLTSRSNYVSLLLTTKDETDHPISDGEMLGDLIDIIGAGQETTSRMIAWTIHALSKDEVLQDRLYDEIKKNVKDSQNLNYDLLFSKQMPLLANTFKEVLRLYPPAGVFSRTTVAEESLGPYRIPAKTNVAISPWRMGRDETLWENPLKFDPDRFNKEQHPFAWVPFGAGRRSCVGMRIALLEGKIMLVKLLENFKFQHNPKYRDPQPISRFTMCPDGDVVVNLKHR